MASKEVLELRIKHAREAIARFRADCERAEYTDPGLAWELLEGIYCGLEGASPYGENGDLSRQWPTVSGYEIRDNFFAGEPRDETDTLCDELMTSGPEKI